MAVENKYVDSDLAALKKGEAITTVGANLFAYVATLEVAAADDDGSVYRLFANVPSNLVPLEITVATDGITGGTDYDLGIYKTTTSGAVIDKDVLMDGQTMASALTRATGHNLGLAAVNIADVRKTLAELSGQTDPDLAYDIALTANTVGTAAGTISVYALFAQN